METIIDVIEQNEVSALKKAQMDITREYLQGLLQLVLMEASITKDIKELTFWKTAMHCDNGAIYTLTLSHVSGPKFQVPKEEVGSVSTTQDFYTGC